jgi:hypothetical protein
VISLQKSYELFLASQLIAMHEDTAKGACEVANFADAHDNPVTSDMMMDALNFRGLCRPVRGASPKTHIQSRPAGLRL